MISFIQDWNYSDCLKKWQQEYLKQKGVRAIEREIEPGFFFHPYRPWSNTTNLPQEKSNKPILAAWIESPLKDQHQSLFKDLNCQLQLSPNVTRDYLVRGDSWHSLGLDPSWELAQVLSEVVRCWQQDKLPSTIKLTVSIGEKIFFEQVKFLALRLLQQKVSKYLNVDLRWEVTAVVSEMMMTKLDAKNNSIRHSFAVMAALLSPIDIIAIRPLPGFDQDETWRLALQTYHVLSLESDLLSADRPQVGASFFENAVTDLVNTVWSHLQTLLMFPNRKDQEQFAHSQAFQQIEMRRQTIADRQKLITGVNDLMINDESSHSEIALNSDTSPLELKCAQYKVKLSAKKLRWSFLFVGDKKSHIEKLNFAQNYLGIAGITAHWKEMTLEEIGEANVIVLVASENEYPDIIKKIMTMAERNPKIILVGLGQENKNITQTYWFDFQKSPFDFWDDFLAALE